MRLHLQIWISTVETTLTRVKKWRFVYSSYRLVFHSLLQKLKIFFFLLSYHLKGKVGWLIFIFLFFTTLLFLHEFIFVICHILHILEAYIEVPETVLVSMILVYFLNFYYTFVFFIATMVITFLAKCLIIYIIYVLIWH